MMSARSPGVITRSPSVIRSRKSLQAHRTDDQPAHLAVRPAVQRPGPVRRAAGTVRPSASATSATVGAARIGASGRAAATRSSPTIPGIPPAHLVDRRGVDAVGHHADQRAAVVTQRREPRRDRVEHLVGRPPAPAHDQQHGCTEVVRGVDVEVQLDGERPGGEVAALDDHDVRLDDLGRRRGRGVGDGGRGDPLADHRSARAGLAVGERAVGGQHALEQPGVPGAVGDVVQVVEGERVRAVVLLRQPEAVEHELEVGVALGRRGDQRAEEPQAPGSARQHLREAEDDRRLAGPRLQGGDVHVAGHVMFLPLKPGE